MDGKGACEMKLLITIPVWTDNAAQCEKLLDHIFALADRLPYGHILLALGADVHAEMKERLRISAKLAFEGVHELEIRSLSEKNSPKSAWATSAFRQIGLDVDLKFRWPFLYMEPDCVPMTRDWHRNLEQSYNSQPKPFMGTQMKTGATEPARELIFMARVGVYPQNALHYLKNTQGPFELANANVIKPLMTPTKLIQQTLIYNQQELTRIREDAVLIHGDKSGLVLQHSIAKHSKPVEIMPKAEALPKNGDTPPDHIFSGFDPVQILIPAPVATKGRKRRTQTEWS